MSKTNSQSFAKVEATYRQHGLDAVLARWPNAVRELRQLALEGRLPTRDYEKILRHVHAADMDRITWKRNVRAV